MRISINGVAFGVMMLILIGGCDAQETAGGGSGSSETAPQQAPKLTAQIKPFDIKDLKGMQEAVVFTPDGAGLVTIDDDGIARLWDTTSGKLQREYPKMRSWGAVLAVSPDGKLIAAGGIEGSIDVWETATGKQVRSFKGGQNVKALAFLDGGSTLAAAGWESPQIYSRGWSLRTGAIAYDVKLAGHPWPGDQKPYSVEIEALAISPDGKWLASSSQGDKDLNVRVWELRRGNEHDHMGIVNMVQSLAFSPDSTLLAAGDAVGKVRIWDSQGRNLGILWEHGDPVRPIAFSPDGKLLASPAQRRVDVWDVASMALRNTLAIEIGGIRSIAFSPDSKFVGVSDNLNAVHVSSADDKSPPEEPGPDFRNSRRDPPMPAGAVKWLAHERTIDCIAFSPDGKLLASGADERVIKFWDPTTHKLLRTLEGMRGTPVWIAFSPDGKILAAACSEVPNSVAGGVEPPNEVKFFDVASGKDIGWIETQPHTDPAVCFATDGKTFFAADKDPEGVIRRFDVKTLKPTSGFTLNLRGETLHSLAVSPDGKELAIGTGAGHEGKLIACNAETGRERFTLAYEGFVQDISFSPDGKWIALVSNDAHIIDVAKGKKERDISHRYYCGGAKFLPGGKLLATAGMGGELFLWEVGGNWPQRGTLPRREGISEGYRYAAVSPDGKLMASVNADELVLWTLPASAAR